MDRACTAGQSRNEGAGYTGDGLRSDERII
jgi:hypothetical protein